MVHDYAQLLVKSSTASQFSQPGGALEFARTFMCWTNPHCVYNNPPTITSAILSEVEALPEADLIFLVHHHSPGSTRPVEVAQEASREGNGNEVQEALKNRV